MGICNGSDKQINPEEAAKNQKLEAAINASKRKSKEVKRLLFLGTGASGKSTFMKQIIQNYGKGFTEKEKLWWKNKASMNIIESLNILCLEGISMKDDNDNINDNIDDDEIFYNDFNFIKKILNDIKLSKRDSLFNNEECIIINRLWKHSLVQFAFDHRGNFPFDFGDIEYFFNKLDKLCDKNYILTHSDITYVRSKTNGVYENCVCIKGVEMIFIDVAGQRSARRKWIGCFSDVTAVIWVSALDNYNQVLFENENVNAMDDALEAFEWAVSHPMLQKPVFALFLNKIDLLKKKIENKPNQFGLKYFFDDYHGDDCNIDHAAKFLKEIFLSCIPNGREIPAYTVQATDSTNANKVLDSVIFGLLENQLGNVFG